MPMVVANTPSHEDILNHLALAYGTTRTELHPLTDNPDDGVYRFIRDGQAMVLKYTPASIRSFAMLQEQATDASAPSMPFGSRR